jgi:AcrR family transcriptional regulator
MSSSARPTKADVVGDFRRTQILDGARQSFVRHGIAGTTMEDVARTAGMAKGTVYLYYKSKDEILQQLIGADLSELQRNTVPAVEGAGTIEERLRRFFSAVLTFFDLKRDFVEHCQFEMSADARRKARQKLGLVFGAQADAWQHAIRDAVEAGTITGDRGEVAARGIVSMAHGLAIQRLRGWSSESIDDTVTWATRLIWQGMAPR